MNDCQHTQRQLVKRIYINGSIHYVRQCLTCGHVTNAISHDDALKELDGKEPPLYYAELRDRWFQQQRSIAQINLIKE